MQTRLRFTNMAQFQRQLKAAGDPVTKAVGAGLYAAGNDIMTASKEHGVPVDTGTLKNSGFVSLPQPESGGVAVEVGYGGPASDYAIKVHEGMQYRHEVGGAKYLERYVDAYSGIFGRTVADEARKALVRGIRMTIMPKTPWGE